MLTNIHQSLKPPGDHFRLKLKSYPMVSTLFKARIYFLVLVTLAVWALLIWDYFHTGVPSHHLLARKDLPSFSNWWGGILLPALTWYLTGRIQKRLGAGSAEAAIPSSVIYAFSGSLLFGILLALFFTLGVSDLSGYMLLLVFGMALFLPVYRPEYLLGFVCGITYTFGGVLPVLIGSVLALVTAMIYRGIRPACLFVFGRVLGR